MTQWAIQTLQLTRSFGDVRAVEEVNLEVPRGSVYAFLGPNGAGKTTTIRLLLGLARPDRGEIRLLDRPFSRGTRRALLRRVGALVEAPALYPHLTGYENLRLTQQLLAVARANIDRVLGIVDLQADAHRLVKTYSQGMRQRLGIALSLLADPDVLILDEPTNGLDPAGIHDIRALIRGFPAEHGITVFLSSHLLAEVEHLATHVGIIGHGRLLFQGTLPEFQTRHRERVLLEVDHPARAIDVLHQHGCTLAATDSPTLTLEITDRADIAHAAAALVGAGVALYQLRSLQPSLEDLFLDLTRETTLAAPRPAPEGPR